MVDSPLIPDAGNQLTAPVQAKYSPAFLKADAAMAQTAGEKVPQSLRYQYWQAINGDKLAAGDPRAAAIAYDTAIMAGPQKAFELLKQTAADPAKMYQARNAYAQQMVAKGPAEIRADGSRIQTAQRDHWALVGVDPRRPARANDFLRCTVRHTCF